MPDPVYPDALARILVPDASPQLTVLRKMTDQKEEFTIKHEPMASPAMPPKPEKVESGRRAHIFHGLNDLRRYLDATLGQEVGKAVAFYTNTGVSVVLDETSKVEKEIVTCNLQRHLQCQRWMNIIGKKMKQPEFLTFLRLNRAVVINEGGDHVLAEFSSLSGTLVHDAEHFLDHSSRSQAFTVKKKKRGTTATEEQSVEVSTEFKIAIKILADDAEPTELTILVQMDGAADAEIVFSLHIDNFHEVVEEHLNYRLEEFASTAQGSFKVMRGEYKEAAWSEQTFPKSIESLMEAQTEMIKAIAGVE